MRSSSGRSPIWSRCSAFSRSSSCAASTRGAPSTSHPSLIPAFCGHGFYGERVHQAVLRSGVKVSGATVHFLNEEYDEGPIILQEAVPVLEGDDTNRLAARVVAAERRLVPRAIRLIAEGRVRIDAGVTHIHR